MVSLPNATIGRVDVALTGVDIVRQKYGHKNDATFKERKGSSDKDCRPNV